MALVLPVLGILHLLDSLLFKEKWFLKHQAFYFHR